MNINVTAKTPAAKATVLTALIDLGADRPLFDKRVAREHPAAADLARRRRGGGLNKPYLAVGDAPLLYLPAQAAKFWDNDEKVRILAARAYNEALARGSASLAIPLDGPAGPAAAPLVAEGLALAAYRFDKYKGTADGEKDLSVKLIASPPGEVREAIQGRLQVIESVNRARDLVNEPGSVATPAEVEARARQVAEAAGLKITVLDDKELAKKGYEGLVTVGRGGNVPPRMIVLKYTPAGAKRGKGPHLGLLGKGLTFDTGGVSIKPASKMWEMKGDMSGAAAVLYAIEAIAAAEAPIPVTAVIVTAQNYVDANSVVPGDIIRARNGKTIHIDNTDAEGRLILTDGLWRMGEEKVTHLVDVATLTGACLRALGTSLSGVFGNDDFANRLADVAGAQGEPCWRLPLVEEYSEWIKCDIADLNNISTRGPNAGATTAALFLREFVPAGVHWAHLDIAGTFIAEKPWKYFKPGATGVMVRTLTALAGAISSDA